MSNHYYNSEDLKKFSNVGDFQKNLADKFFDYYGEVFKDSELSAKEKSLIALAVAHALPCPYCIDAYSSEGLKKEERRSDDGSSHGACAIRGGASLVHDVPMINKVKEIAM